MKYNQKVTLGTKKTTKKSLWEGQIQPKSHFGEIEKCQNRPKIEGKIAPLQYTTYHWVWSVRLTPDGPTLTAMLSPRKPAPTGSCRNLESKGLTLELDQFRQIVNAYNLEPSCYASNLLQYGRTLGPEPDRFRPNLYALPQDLISISRPPLNPPTSANPATASLPTRLQSTGAWCPAIYRRLPSE